MTAGTSSRRFHPAAVALLACALPLIAQQQQLNPAQKPDPAQQPNTSQQPVQAPPATAPADSTPIAIVPIDTASSVTGALEVASGKAVIARNGSITSTTRATEVILPRRGTLKVCAATTIKLATDTSVPAGDTPGLLMALDQGALEMSFAGGHNADILLTPDFRILVSGPGPVDLKVRLGQHGDTCIDNGAPAADAAYVLVTSVFDASTYRVQPAQRVMFQNGSLQQVVDSEKEPCGCPSDPRPGSNDFPLAQSAGLTAQPPPVARPSPPAPSAGASGTASQAPPVLNQPLVYQASPASSAEPENAAPSSTAAPAPSAPVQPAPGGAKSATRPNLFRRFGHLLRKIFGAE